MPKNPIIIFFNCSEADSFKELLAEGWEFELVGSLAELRELTRDKEEQYVVFVGSDKIDGIVQWLKGHRKIIAFNTYADGNCIVVDHAVDALNPKMSKIELESRIMQGQKKHLSYVALFEYSQRINRDKNIQTQMNDRLLKVSVELKLAKEKIEELSLTDSLTQLKNRRFFDGQLEREVLQCSRYGTELSLFFIDIDNFKHFNDKYGHQVGDEILVKLSELVQSSLRDTDWAARYGGEEFCVILPMTDIRGALKTADRLRLLVEQSLQVEEEKITISIGLAQFGGDVKKGTDLVRIADLALFESKNNGKNKVTFYDFKKKEYCESSSGEAQQSYR